MYPRPEPRRRKKISKGVRRRVYERDRWTCQDCGLVIPPQSQEEATGHRAPKLPTTRLDAPLVWLEIDHIVPIALGGTNEPGNLRAACSDCNRRKSNSTRLAQAELRCALALHLLSTRRHDETTVRMAIAALTGGSAPDA